MVVKFSMLKELEVEKVQDSPLGAPKRRETLNSLAEIIFHHFLYYLDGFRSPYEDTP